ncbi:MAG: DNA-3-methyladenine glycosylase I [Burkholderiaceae bacterium]
MKKQLRCSWAESSEAMAAYHDEEWGAPEHDSRALWEKLVLESFQSGLSWAIILRKREAFRKAFRKFDPKKVARFTEEDVERLMQDEGIVRMRAKIEATIVNARAFLAMEKAGEDFSAWAWGMVGGKPLVHHGPRVTKTALAETMSRELKKRGFKFVGAVTVYSWMQATGLVNDHDAACFRR